MLTDEKDDVTEEEEDNHNKGEKKKDGWPEAEDREKDVSEDMPKDMPEDMPKDAGGGHAGVGRVRRRRPRVKDEEVFKINTITY